MSVSHPQQLMDVLGALERCLETPIVPGELELWLDEARSATQQAEALLEFELNQRHPEILADIEQQDAELSPRVDQLRAGDCISRDLLRELQNRLSRLSRTPGLTPDERRGDDEVAAVIETGLRFIIHARTQEVSLETWLAESFERDRGTVD